MRIVGVLFVCLLLCLAAFGQEKSDDEEKTKIEVAEITLSRDVSSGDSADDVESFSTTDVPIYCSILLNRVAAATVKMNFVAARAAGLKAESVIVAVSYKTNDRQNRGNFNASPADVWAAGKYRVDIFIDGKLSKSKTFEIIKTVSQKIAPKSKKRVRKN